MLTIKDKIAVTVIAGSITAGCFGLLFFIIPGAIAGYFGLI